jgi:hypothetical protein
MLMVSLPRSQSQEEDIETPGDTVFERIDGFDNFINTQISDQSSPSEESIPDTSTFPAPMQTFNNGNDYPMVADGILMVRSEVEDMIRGNPVLASKFVRLAFNDCVGGCDGCVDLHHPKNFGLDHPIFALQPIVDLYSGNYSGLSRADIWALAALTGAEMSQGSEKVSFDMKWFGRVDCENTDQICTNREGHEVECSATRGSHRNIPDPNLSTRELLQWFEQEFGFDTYESVALMGAHSLGQKRQFNTGYDGSSTVNEYRLDNEYYKQLIAGGLQVKDTWRQEQILTYSTPFVERWQWKKHGEEEEGKFLAMLTVDMGLRWDFDGYMLESGRVVCELDATPEASLPLCPHASMTLSLMEQYVGDNMLWLFEFSDVLGRMLVHGYDLKHECTAPPCRLDSKEEQDNVQTWRDKAKDFFNLWS